MSRLLLRLYPREFRREYGGEWLELARQRSWRALAVDTLRVLPPLWLRHLGSTRASRAEGGTGMEGWIQDLRFGLRSLRRRPVFAVIAVVTLALGIGSATTMYSVVQAVLIDSVPFARGDRLVDVWQIAEHRRGAPGLSGQTWDRHPMSFRQYREWQARNTAFEAIAVHQATQMTFDAGGDADRVWVGFGSASLLSVLGVRPALGRWFRPDEEGRTDSGGAALVTVLSHEMWDRRFGGNPNILGKEVTLNGRGRTVIGILPAGFRLRYLGLHWLGADRDGVRVAWVPIGTPGHGPGQVLEAIGRLAPGVLSDRAVAEATRIFSISLPNARVRLAPRSSDETRGLKSPLLLLLGATGLLLLIGCANAAALFFGELVTRQRELATRIALGAPTRRIVRQLLSETLVLGVWGSLLGIGLAFAGTHLMVALGPPLPRINAIAVDSRVLLFAIGVGLLAVFVSGTLPALAGTRPATFQMVFDPGRTVSRHRGRRERTVVALEVTMTVALLVVAGLLGRSVSRLLAVEPGFDPAGLATVRVALPRGPAGSLYRVQGEILRRLHELPGVVGVAATTRLPFPGETFANTMSVTGPDGTPCEFRAQIENVTPGYHATLRIPLRSGRTFTDADNATSPPVVMISESIARRYWPGRSPIGARILGPHDEYTTVVGVVAAASLVPVRRITRVAPADVLREE